MSLSEAFKQARKRRYGSEAGQPASFVASTDPTAPKADDEGSVTCPYCGESFTPGEQDETGGEDDDDDDDEDDDGGELDDKSYRTDDEAAGVNGDDDAAGRQAKVRRVTEAVKKSLREKGFKI